MKLNWTTSITNKNGDTIFKTDAEGAMTKETMTFKDCVTAALDSWDQKQDIKPSEKYKRYEVIKKIHEEADLDIDDITTVKKAVDAHPFLPFVYGQICDILNNKEPQFKVVKGE